LFTAVGIVAGVSLSVWLAKRDGIPTEVGQEVALVAVPCAIVGARLFFVGEHWGQFKNDLPSIVTDVTEGGITLYGGLMGGVLGGVVYTLIRRWPVAILLDAAAPGMILGQAIGRIGDLINGEHLGSHSDLPWAVRYTNPNTAGELGVSVHPTAGGYELLGDLLILGMLLLVARRYLRVPGWTFCLYVAVYAIMRFFLSYFRLDEREFGGVPIPQWVSGGLAGVAIIVAGAIARHPGPITPEYAERAWGEGPEEPAEKRHPAPA
jgi:prolipoprotein diacylglyceryl transferase